MNIWLDGIFYNGHGLAEGNRALLRILERAGYRIRITPRDRDEKHASLPAEEVRYISSFEHTELLSRDVYIYNWVGTYAEPKPEFAVNIARTTFETDRIPPSWVPRLNGFDEVWVQSAFNQSTFAQSGVQVPMRLIPNFFDYSQFSPEGSPLSLGIPESFKFLSVFDLKKRKGYDILLKAFIREFTAQDDVALVIKLRDYWQSDKMEEILSVYSKPEHLRPAIYVIDHMLEPRQIAGLYRMCDAFVLPTRGEGWGRPFFEAMLMELPVIGTNWSGHLDFMNEGNAYLVKIKGLTPISHNENPLFDGHCWAEPSTKDLQKKMRLVVEQRHEAKQTARAARKELLHTYSSQATSRKIVAELEKYRPNLQRN